MHLNLQSLLLVATVTLFGLCIADRAAQAKDVFGIVVGHTPASEKDKVPEQVSFALVDDTTTKVTCNISDVQKYVGRQLENQDQVRFIGGLPDAASPACQLALRTETIGFWKRIGATMLGFAIVVGAASLAAWGRPAKFLLGVDGRYSNSQCQLALWFGAAMTFYIATIVLRAYQLGWNYLDGVSITANVTALAGLSALTFGGAKIVTAQKVATADTQKAGIVAQVAAAAATAARLPMDVVSAVKEAAASAGAAGAPAAVAATLNAAGHAEKIPTVTPSVVAAGKVGPTKSPGHPNIFTDLFQNDQGQVDLGDFQMIFIALTAAVLFALSCFSGLASLPYLAHASLPDVDTALLAGFGIGQGAYLVKKAALPLGQG